MRRLPRFVFLGGLVVLGLGGFVACASDDSGTTPEDPTEGGTSTPDSSRPDTSTPPPIDSSTGTDATGTDAGSDATVTDTGTDAKVDTGTDTGVDAGPTTRLFFGGDFAVNNTSALGRALVPAGGTLPASAVIAPKASAYALTPDGTKIVFSADITVAGRADLYVANADGTNVQLRYALPANTASISEIAISPDGNTVAYIADAELDGQQDVYVVPLAGAAAPVRVSPTRANADLDAQSIAFSRNSTYLAFAGDFTTNLKNELYTVDVGAAVPAAVAVLADANIPAPPGTAAVGVSTNLRPLWTAGGKVCAKANLEAATPVFRLYCANADGTGFAEPTNLPALPAQIGTYGLSPDGATLAFSADSAAQPGAYEVFTMPSDDSAAATRITSGTLTAVAGTNRGTNFSIPLVFSPDASKIAFVGDWLVDDRNELFVVPAAGGTEKRLAVVGPANDAERDVQGLVWAPDGLQIAFICDHRVNNDFELFRVLDVTTADQAPSLIRAVVGSGDVDFNFALEWRP